MPFNEWLESRLAIADRSSQMIIEIRDKVNNAIKDLGSSQVIAKYRLKGLLRELDSL